MTPIEELRKGLDECGIRHIDHDGRGQEGTVWYDPDTTHWSLYGRAFKYTSKQGQDGKLYVKTSGATNWVEMTPEQTISATIGAGTCHYIPEEMGFTWWDENDVEHYEEDSASEDCGFASCDKCGNQMMVGDEGWFGGWDKIAEWTEEDGSEHKGYVLKPIFKYCPNCGRRIEVSE